ncbi:unnamed protein product, partial [Meganyctiphanes norvegica]
MSECVYDEHVANLSQIISVCNMDNVDKNNTVNNKIQNGIWMLALPLWAKRKFDEWSEEKIKEIDREIEMKQEMEDKHEPSKYCYSHKVLENSNIGKFEVKPKGEINVQGQGGEVETKGKLSPKPKPKYFVNHVNKSYQCRSCNKTYQNYDNLMNHLMTHTEENPYQCRQCD